jgi:hexosaminidase
LETFVQLLETDERDKYLKNLPIYIEDTPRFKWRGLSIDISKNFLKMEKLKMIIDTMEMVKLNVLHLKLSSLSNFPVQLTTLPNAKRINKMLSITKIELLDLSMYAREKGIR